ncbi:MAG TPA: UDP-2,3-diacylglucosamine diphosphatase [Gemmataceae bacterium]|nr:UDP-2,3-diacylglucosamine diphosphatase [Gemmataceae bacterium]
MFDAIVLSDIHLGSSNCQAKNLTRFLEKLADEEITTARLVLNGDVFDSIDFRRLNKSHWKVLSLIRKLSDRMDIIWICGNHDGDPDVISHLLGVTVKDEAVLTSGGRKVLFMHGHLFDDFIDAHPILTWIGDCIYLLLQKIDKSHSFAKLAKKGSKTFLRCARKIEEGAVEHARRKGCDVVCCGHTHHAVAKCGPPVAYYNSGCWTELPCTYLTVCDGKVELHSFGTAPVTEPLAQPALAVSGE